MIAHLTGKILHKTPRAAILQAGHLGYLVHLSSNHLSLITKDQTLELFIHSHIREDAFDLYGFSKLDELELFKQLLSVNGIGPKVALEILNTPQEALLQALESEDLAFIKRIPGIGEKTAKRLLLELRGKLAPAEERQQKGLKQHDPDLIAALEKLGYNQKQIQANLEKLPENLQTLEEKIRFFLMHS